MCGSNRAADTANRHPTARTDLPPRRQTRWTGAAVWIVWRVPGSRYLDLSFSANGYLTGVGVEGVAALGETAKALGETPAEVASGVDSYTGIQSRLASA